MSDLLLAIPILVPLFVARALIYNETAEALGWAILGVSGAVVAVLLLIVHRTRRQPRERA